MTRFWNKIDQVRSMSKDWKEGKIIQKPLEARNPMGLHMRAKLGDIWRRTLSLIIILTLFGNCKFQ